MFDELSRILRQLDGQKITVTPDIAVDEDGYIDRECPHDDCMFEFKVHDQDWREIVRDEEVFCPFCGHAADAQKWWTTEQIEKIQEQALAQVKGTINQAMRRDAEAFNRRQRKGSFITVKMKVESGLREIVLPAAAAEPMRLKLTCEECSCRFAVIGSAFFCPSCGHNSADRVFRQSLNAIRASLDAIPAIRSGISDADASENTIRLLTEAGLQNVVMAFQRFAEAHYQRQPDPIRVRRNAFQNLSEGSQLWRTAFGRGFDDHLSTSELTELARLFQQRHLLAHCEGIVDADYISRSGDPTYREGQRLVIRESVVRMALQLVEKLSVGMAADLAPSD